MKHVGNRQEQFDELVRLNQGLVRTANDMRIIVRQARTAIGQVLDAAEPIAGQHDEEPVEYVVPVEEIDELRAVLTVANGWITRDSGA